jgi:hypothetical protein
MKQRVVKVNPGNAVRPCEDAVLIKLIAEEEHTSTS